MFLSQRGTVLLAVFAFAGALHFITPPTVRGQDIYVTNIDYGGTIGENATPGAVMNASLISARGPALSYRDFPPRLPFCVLPPAWLRPKQIYIDANRLPHAGTYSSRSARWAMHSSQSLRWAAYFSRSARRFRCDGRDTDPKLHL